MTKAMAESSAEMKNILFSVTKGEAWKNGLINICEEEGESLWRKKY
jgi:hypothetical protein